MLVFRKSLTGVAIPEILQSNKMAVQDILNILSHSGKMQAEQEITWAGCQQKLQLASLLKHSNS